MSVMGMTQNVKNRVLGLIIDYDTLRRKINVQRRDGSED